MSNNFIFVVCGAKEHIDTLHFSLVYLKKHSINEIWVLTDSTRNEIPIVHDNIVDVKTPANFDHHQASIYLKTGIHKFFPKGNNYCYLDTDIIALSNDVDNIFKEYHSPITFAPDHCKMDQFSPYALNCGCLKENEHYFKVLNDKMDEQDPLRMSNDVEIVAARKEWQSSYSRINASFNKKVFFGLKYVVNRKRFNLSADIYCDRKKKVWIKDGKTIFMKQLNMNKICKEIGLKWRLLRMEPMTPKGNKLWGLKCNHLQEIIYKNYGLKLSKDFQHWNGGVFLFNDTSHSFLETWHQSTMDIFKDPYWKTRDQGTLIKTVWEFGLQKHPTLNKKWNLIADYHNPLLSWVDKETIQLNSNEYIKPALVHVYHHFGDENWTFWNFIENKL